MLCVFICVEINFIELGILSLKLLILQTAERYCYVQIHSRFFKNSVS